MKKQSRWKRYGTIFQNLLFPPRCAICADLLTTAEWNGFLCAACQRDPSFLQSTVCPRCHSETSESGFCAYCLRPFAFSFACGIFPYEKVRKAIHLYKYTGGKSLSVGMGTLMATYLQKAYPQVLEQTDLLMTVPLHPKKEKRRGFHQTHLLCLQIAAQTGVPYAENGLLRKRDTVAQSTLTPEERKANLQNVFAVNQEVQGKRILLIDDIFTTGTTCNECAKALLRAGAQSVAVCCLAVAGASGKGE